MTALARPGDGGEGRRLLAPFLAAAAAHGALAAAMVYAPTRANAPPGEQQIAIDLAPAMQALESVQPAAVAATLAAVASDMEPAPVEAPPIEALPVEAPAAEAPALEAAPAELVDVAAAELNEVTEAPPQEIAEARPQKIAALDLPMDATPITGASTLDALIPPDALEEVVPPKDVAAAIPAPPRRPEMKSVERPPRERARPQETAARTARRPSVNSTARAGAAASSRENLGGSAASGDPAALQRWTSQIAATLRNRLRYPETARTAGWTGVAMVRFTVEPNGRVVSSRLVRSSGNSVLDSAALATVAPGAQLPAAPPGAPARRLTVSAPLRFAM